MPESACPIEPIAVADTVRWLERAVIGLNLCPFAKAPHVKGQIHYALSQAKNLAGLREELAAELQALQAMPAEQLHQPLALPDAAPDPRGQHRPRCRGFPGGRDDL